MIRIWPVTVMIRAASGNHTECGGFTAARWSDENNELLIGNIDGEIVDRFVPILIDLVDVGKL